MVIGIEKSPIVRFYTEIISVLELTKIGINTKISVEM